MNPLIRHTDAWFLTSSQGNSTARAFDFLQAMNKGHIAYTAYNLCSLQNLLSSRPQQGHTPVELARHGLVLLKCSQSYCIHWMDKDWLFNLLEANVDLLLNDQKPCGCWKLSTKLVEGVAKITYFLFVYVSICKNEQARTAAIRARSWLLKAEVPDKLIINKRLFF